MKFLAALVAAATSVFCAGLFAQEGNAHAMPVSPASPATPTTPATIPAPVGAPVGQAPAALPSGPLSQAEVAATQWLALTDAGDHARSWREAASLLQNSVTQSQWESALQASRVPLGSVKSRTLKAATFSRTLAGVPDGEYGVIEYETGFASKSLAIETVTIMKDQDDRWKVAGYFIR